MERRTFLLYIPELGGGGAERVFATLAEGFRARGHHVVIAVDHTPRSGGQEIDPAIRIVTLPRGHGPGTLALSRLLGEVNPDIAMAALGSGNLKLTLAALPRGMARRCILTFHGFYGVEPKLLSTLGYLTLGLLSRVTGATVAVSAALAENLIARCKAAPTRTHVIHNPIPLEGRHAADADELRARPPLILAAGRLAPEKHFDRLLEAFALLRTPGARLRIVGEGHERPALEARAARLGIAGRLDMPGYQYELRPHYDSARCFVVSSRSEAFCNVVAEALAHGLPVVSTACGGPEEILENGRFGALTPVDDPPALARALEAALAAPGDPAPRIARARDFGADGAITLYEKLMEAVMAAAKPKHQGAPTRHHWVNGLIATSLVLTLLATIDIFVD